MKKYLLLFVLLGSIPLFAQSTKKDKPQPPTKIEGTVIARKTVTLPADPSGAAQKPGVNPTTYGHQAVLTWTLPTTCTDGSPCTATSTNIYKANSVCPTGSGLTGATKIASVPAPTTTYTDTNIIAPGSYCYYVTAVNSQGESTASNNAGGSLTQPTIGAPTNFTVVAQ